MTSDDLFQHDEMRVRKVNPEWSRDDLLKEEGLFFLKDLDEPLGISRLLLYRKLRELKAANKDPWEELGIRKNWSRWQIRMTVFAPFYQDHLITAYAETPKGWDANSVIQQTEGVYLLAKISRLIPFTNHQIRYQAKILPDAKKVMGVWKDKASNLFLVDLAAFAPWLKGVWQSGLQKKLPKKTQEPISIHTSRKISE